MDVGRESTEALMRCGSEEDERWGADGRCDISEARIVGDNRACAGQEFSGLPQCESVDEHLHVGPELEHGAVVPPEVIRSSDNRDIFELIRQLRKTRPTFGGHFTALTAPSNNKGLQADRL